jgi:hypothetical protein|tara:strand:- start:84 stop:344 length:261 start_codon:yes stop_codon:yes gene_type:complete
MLANIIYLTVFIILAFVLSIAVKAITRGVEAKQILKEENIKNFNKDKDEISENSEIVSQLKELTELHSKGLINDDEFRKAKEKLLG